MQELDLQQASSVAGGWDLYVNPVQVLGTSPFISAGGSGTAGLPNHPPAGSAP